MRKQLLSRVMNILLVVLISFSSKGFCQQKVTWPSITRENKPWTRWWWQGSAVDKAGLTSAMQKYREAGLGGLEITPIYA